MGKSLRIGFVGLVLSVATAWAGPSVIQGVVKDAKGQALRFRWSSAGRVPRVVGREWRGEGLDHEYENEGRSVDATEFRRQTGVGGASKRSCEERKKAHDLGAVEHWEPHRRTLGGSRREWKRRFGRIERQER